MSTRRIGIFWIGLLGLPLCSPGYAAEWIQTWGAAPLPSTAAMGPYPATPAFNNQTTRRLAIHRIAIVIAALEDGCTAESVSERIYNCVSVVECIEEGASKDPELRIFETGWSELRPNL
jgi:hypothetical protein